MKKDKYCIVIKKEDNQLNLLGIYQILVESRAERDSWFATFLSHGATKVRKKINK